MKMSRRQFNFLSAATTAQVALGTYSSTLKAATPEDSDYLFKVPFAPVGFETQPLILQTIVGKIPQDLKGTYFRNGPNPKFVPEGRYHWFDGDGMIHAVHLGEQGAAYNSRMVKTRKLQKEVSAGRSLYAGFREKPRFQNIYDFTFEHLPFFPDVSNTDLVHFNGKLYSTCAPLGEMYEINQTTLETVKRENFNNQLKNLVAAHSRVDTNTGDLIYFGFDTPLLDVAGVPCSSAKSHLFYGVIRNNNKGIHSATIEIDRPKNIHDWAITQNYSVLLDQPLEITLNGLKFNRNKPSRYGFIPRFGTAKDVIWIETKADYIIHMGNAFEKDERYVVMHGMDVPDVGTPENEDVSKPFHLKPIFTRWVFDLKAKKLVEKVPLLQEWCDFPTTNEYGYLTKENRYTYMGRMNAQSGLYELDAVVKYDHKENRKSVFELGSGRYGNEFSFVPRKNSQAEDDGYLVGFVYDSNSQRSEFVVLDGTNLTLLARVDIPVRVPSGFHGTWINS